MADCFYHGQSGSGPCPDCEYAERTNQEPHEVSSTCVALPFGKGYDIAGNFYAEKLKSTNDKSDKQ